MGLWFWTPIRVPRYRVSGIWGNILRFGDVYFMGDEVFHQGWVFVLGMVVESFFRWTIGWMWVLYLPRPLVFLELLSSKCIGLKIVMSRIGGLCLRWRFSGAHCINLRSRSLDRC